LGRPSSASALPRRHQDIGDELGFHRHAHQPTDHAPGRQIDHRGNVELAFRPPTRRCSLQFINPFAIGSGRREGTVEYIGSDGDLPPTRMGRQSTPAPSGVECLPLHLARSDAGHTKRPPQQIAREPPGSVDSVAADETRPNLGAKLFGAAATSVPGPIQLRTEPAPRDTERPAHRVHSPDPR
jgi:hypothetical protein